MDVWVLFSNTSMHPNVMFSIRCYHFFLIILLPVLGSCKGPGFSVTQLPENGYAQTINYQFQATIRSDTKGDCKQLIVRVRPLNKMYSGNQPPDRLQLFDDDCNRPLRFERINYIERGTNEPVRLSGPEVNRFWSDYSRIESEMIEWLWRAGIEV